MTLVLQRFDRRRFAKIQTYDHTAFFPTPSGDVAVSALGVDTLGRVWMAVSDAGASGKLVILDHIRGTVLATVSVSPANLRGRAYPDTYGRMWFADTTSVKAYDALTFAQVASVTLTDGVDNYDNPALIAIRDTSNSIPYIMVAATNVVTDVLRAFQVVTTPGSEAIGAFTASVASTGTDSPFLSPSAFNAAAGDVSIVTDLNRTNALLLMGSTPSLATLALSTAATAGIRGSTAAFGYLWVGTDPVNGAGAGPPQILVVEPDTAVTTDNVRHTFVLSDALYVADLFHDDRYVYAVVVKEVNGVPATANTLIKIDPDIMAIVETVVVNAAGVNGEPLLSFPHATDLFSHRFPPMADAVLHGNLGEIDSRLYVPGSGFPAPFFQGAIYRAHSLAVTLFTGTYSTIGAPCPTRWASRPFTLEGVPMGRFKGQRTAAFGAGEALALALDTRMRLNQVDFGALLTTLRFLHDGTGMTVALVFHPISTAAKRLFNTMTNPTLTTSRGLTIEWSAGTLTVTIGNGGGVSFVVSASTAGLAVGRTHVVIIRYSETATTKVTVHVLSQLGGGSVTGDPVSSLTQVLAPGTLAAPSASNPDHEPEMTASLGYMPEIALFKRYLASIEVIDLAAYMRRRWLGVYGPSDSPDQETWLRGDDTSILFAGVGEVSSVPNRGACPGRTNVTATPRYNMPRPFQRPTGDTAYPGLVATGPLGLGALTFSTSVTGRLEAFGQPSVEFRWLHGGGRAGGGNVAGMTLAWTFQFLDTATSQVLFSTGAALLTSRGIAVSLNGTTGIITVQVSNGAAYILSFTSGAFGTLVLGTTYRCILTINFSGTATLRINGNTSSTGTVVGVPSDSNPVGTLRIGGPVGATTSPFGGRIGEVSGYRRLLTSQELTDLDSYLRRWTG